MQLKHGFVVLALALGLVPSLLVAQDRRMRASPSDTTVQQAGNDSLKLAEIANRPAVVTHHSMQLNGKRLDYTATTGMLAIRDEKSGASEGYMLYVAYTRDGSSDPAARPITFASESTEQLPGFRVENEERRVSLVITHVDELGVRSQCGHNTEGKAIVKCSGVKRAIRRNCGQRFGIGRRWGRATKPLTAVG